MAEREFKPQVGDIVCKVASSRQMIVVDVDKADPERVTVAWRPGPQRSPMETVFHRSSLVRVKAAGEAFRGGR